MLSCAYTSWFQLSWNRVYVGEAKYMFNVWFFTCWLYYHILEYPSEAPNSFDVMMWYKLCIRLYSVYIGVIRDQLLDQRFLMDTKFGKYLRHFMACIIYYTYIVFNAIPLICLLKCTYNLFLFVIFECRVLWFIVFRPSICYL